MRRLLAVAIIIGAAGLLARADAPCAIGSFLGPPCYSIRHSPTCPKVPYLPQPGDVMLATDPNLFWAATHNWALAFQPHNSAVVIAMPDGSLAILEAGPNDTLWVNALPMLPHLHEYECKGPVWIRKRKCPLTPEQSCALTDFAMRQIGKRFALIRLGAQLLYIRNRGPVRTCFMGKPRGDRRNYFCSELVTEALVACGALDAETARPGATYPHDLFYDRSPNCYLNHHPPLACDWEPPARWSSCP